MVLSPIAQRIKEKVERAGTPLKDWDIRINYGIKTGYNEAFIIDETKRQELIEKDPKSDEIIRPILRGRDIKRYAADWQGLYLIATHNGYNSPDGKWIDAVDTKEYPAIKSHLDSYWSKINERYDKGNTPYNLRSCNYWEDFYRQKIVWAELARTGNAFTFDTNEHFVGNTGYILTMYDDAEKRIGYEWLLAFLNSNAILFYLDIICNRLDETGWRWLRQHVELLPVPILSMEKQKNMTKIVHKELCRVTDSGQTKINTLVSDFYGFNKEEKAFLDGQFLRK